MGTYFGGVSLHEIREVIGPNSFTLVGGLKSIHNRVYSLVLDDGARSSAIGPGDCVLLPWSPNLPSRLTTEYLTQYSGQGGVACAIFYEGETNPIPGNLLARISEWADQHAFPVFVINGMPLLGFWEKIHRLLVQDLQEKSSQEYLSMLSGLVKLLEERNLSAARKYIRRYKEVFELITPLYVLNLSLARPNPAINAVSMDSVYRDHQAEAEGGPLVWFARDRQSISQLRNLNIKALVNNGRCVLFYCPLNWRFREQYQSPGLMRRGLKTARTLYEAISGAFPDKTVVVTVGNPAVTTQDIPDSYQEAMLSNEVGLFQGRAGYFHYRDVPGLSLLKEVASSALGKRFTTGLLSPLITYDRERKGALLQTLDAYLSCQTNKNLTAKKLFIHKNTLAYRLRLIEKLTGRSIRDQEAFLELYLALWLFKLSRAPQEP